MKRLKVRLIDWELSDTTHTVWTAGLLVKDAITLTFKHDKLGVFCVEVMINYSARGYGRMVIQSHYRLDGRMFWKHYQYMQQVIKYRDNYVMPVLDELVGKKFKSVNAFIKEYNKRAYKYYG